MCKGEANMAAWCLVSFAYAAGMLLLRLVFKLLKLVFKLLRLVFKLMKLIIIRIFIITKLIFSLLKKVLCRNRTTIETETETLSKQNNYPSQEQAWFDHASVLQIGRIKLEVVGGNIVDEKTDAIVSIRNGVVEKAVKQAGGPALKAEMQKLDGSSKIAVTSGGNLKFKVIHVVTPKFKNESEVTETVLHLADLLELTSVSMPPFGTGNGGRSPTAVAPQIIKAVVNKVAQLSTLRHIRIVVFEPNVLSVFVQAFGAEKGTLPVQLLTTAPRFLDDLPPEWKRMLDAEFVRLVNLDASSMEFKEVAQRFNATAPNKVFKVERVQSVRLYKQYAIHVAAFKKKYKSTNPLERRLYHGTDAGKIATICDAGFNRNYSGTAVGTLYGQGVYFARDAKYSLSYAKGKKVLFEVLVLTGDFAVGNGTMRHPPSKSQENPADVYHTTVDSLQNPSIFVTYHDNQNYPAYLIHFE